MLELNEFALENVTGGTISNKIAEEKSETKKLIKDFKFGFMCPYAGIYLGVHDTVVPEDKRYFFKENPTSGTGFVASMATYSAISIGAYEGVKFAYKKIRSRKQ